MKILHQNCGKMKNNVLPELKILDKSSFVIPQKRLLITSEGFEERSLSFAKLLQGDKIFIDAFICKYYPEKRSRDAELLPLIENITKNEPQLIEFSRYEPYKFEEKFQEQINHLVNYDEIVIDISVMSKLLICIIVYLFKNKNVTIRIIYCEPNEYCPTFEEYNSNKDIYGKALDLPSFGVHDVVRTPFLSSIVMQRTPSVLITFLSFNEQLIRALLSSLNPAHLILINGIPPHLKWREKAMQEIHNNIINEFHNDNPLNKGFLSRRTSTLYMEQTFESLANIYKEYCFTNRIIISPTGSKMQAVACALLKICCPDVHIEYPTPESYFIKGFSSSTIRNIHELQLPLFKSLITNIAEEYQLNF